MGAVAGEAYVQLGLPAEFDEPTSASRSPTASPQSRAEHARRRRSVATSPRPPALVIAVTVVGHAGRGRAARRAATAPARATWSVVTGELGGAAAGLLLLERPELREAVDGRGGGRAGRAPAQALAAARGRRARSRRPGRRAMIDVSDGLGADAGHLAAASGVGIEIERRAAGRRRASPRSRRRPASTSSSWRPAAARTTSCSWPSAEGSAVEVEERPQSVGRAGAR